MCSRRITDEHRLTYNMDMNQNLIIYSCKFHYEDQHLKHGAFSLHKNHMVSENIISGDKNVMIYYEKYEHNDGAKQCIVQLGDTFASDSKMVVEYRAEPIRRYYIQIFLQEMFNNIIVDLSNICYKIGVSTQLCTLLSASTHTAIILNVIQ